MAQNGLLDFLQGASNSVASNVSAPVDGLAWLLRKAGVPIQNPVGGSDWMAQKGLTVQPQNKVAGLLGEAFGGVAPMVAAAKAPQIAAGLLQAGANAVAPQVLRKESGMFIGPSAKTWDAEAASKAQQLAAKGVDPRTIWSETGTWKGPDGMWRQEIPDNNSFLKGTGTFGDVTMKRMEALGKADGSAPVVANDVLYHSPLYSAYPELATTEMQFMPKNQGGGRIGSDGVIQIGFNETGDKARSIAAHEMQHAIQSAEGFAKGGSAEGMPSIFREIADQKAKEMRNFSDMAYSGDPLNMSDVRKPGALKKALSASKAMQDAKGMAARVDQFPELGFDAYKKLAGEAEARATQARLPLDAAQRRALFPEDSYDVPMNQLIVRLLGK
jgi:hypothetical protein